MPTAKRDALIACVEQARALTRKQRDYLPRPATAVHRDLRSHSLGIVRAALGTDRSPERDVARRTLNLPLDEQHWDTAKADWFGWGHWIPTRGRWFAHGMVGIACYRLLTVPPPTLRWWALLLGMPSLKAFVLLTMRDIAGGSEKDLMTKEETERWLAVVQKVYYGLLSAELLAARFFAHGHAPLLAP